MKGEIGRKAWKVLGMTRNHKTCGRCGIKREETAVGIPAICFDCHAKRLAQGLR